MSRSRKTDNIPPIRFGLVHYIISLQQLLKTVRTILILIQYFFGLSIILYDIILC